MKAIRAYCLECAGAPGEVRKCVMTRCPLWPLRMGRWPKIEWRRLDLEQREAVLKELDAGRSRAPTL